jgi:hypothetical protein
MKLSYGRFEKIKRPLAWPQKTPEERREFKNSLTIFRND